MESVSRTIAEHANGPKIVVEKSTVPVKAAESIRHILREAEKLNPDLSFQVSKFTKKSILKMYNFGSFPIRNSFPREPPSMIWPIPIVY
jgi:hypothetical protein